MQLPAIFRLTRWTIVAFVLASATAMWLYPGGTFLDPSTTRYLFFQNFLSDLGIATTWGRHSNRIGATLFVASELVLALVLIAFFAGLVRLHSAQTPSRRWARAGGAAGVLAGLAFVAAALLPADRVLALHVQAAIWAFRAILVATALFAFACARDVRFSRRAALAWLALTITLVLYVVMLEWGPRLTSPENLFMQVTAQKISVGAVLAAVAYLSREAERVVLFS
jgi:hypothetical membrane protein